MAKQKFIPRSIFGRVLWLNNFAAKLPIYATKYNVSLTNVEAIQVAAIYYEFVVNANKQTDEYKIGQTAHRVNLENGKVNFGQTDPFPMPPVFEDSAAVPPIVLPQIAPNGIFKVAAAIGNSIKSSINFDQGDGHDMGLIGETITFDPTTAKPVFTIRTVHGGHPEIIWTKGLFHGVAIFVKRQNEGEFVFLDKDNNPNFIDMHPLPPSGRAEIWQYILIYLYKDQYMGDYSDIGTISVKGI